MLNAYFSTFFHQLIIDRLEPRVHTRKIIRYDHVTQFNLFAVTGANGGKTTLPQRFRMVHQIIVTNEQIEYNYTWASMRITDQLRDITIQTTNVLAHCMTNVTRHIKRDQT